MTAKHQTQRDEAARLLRIVRSGDTDQTDELLDWLFSMMPDRRAIVRLKLRGLLAAGDVESAESIIARAVLRWPTDSSFALYRARCLTQRGLRGQALRELELSMKMRPHHVETICFAAEVADQLGNGPAAVQFWRRASDRRPGDQMIKVCLVNALLNTECVRAARDVLQTMTPMPPVLFARVLRHEHRPLDALNILRNALRKTTDVERRDELATAMLALLEDMGDVRGLRSEVALIEDDQPGAVEYAARAMLSIGEFSLSLELCRRLTARPTHRRVARHVMVVAATRLSRHDLARASLQELLDASAGVDRRLMAECWLRAFRGRLLQRQCTARAAGADPSQSLLQPLLADAVETFDRHLRGNTEGPYSARRAELDHHHALCLAALGRVGPGTAARLRSRPAA